MTEPTSLEGRIQRLEDHATIVALATRYAVAIDEADWDAFRDLFTETVHIDFSQAGMPAADFPRDDFVAFAKRGLEVWDARQHISSNHRVTFDDHDDTRASLRSYMFAQHHMAGSPAFVMHGSYEHVVTRTGTGWRIARLTQNVTWMDNPPAEMLAR